MAMNLTNADKLLKVRYIGQLREQLNNAKILMAKIGRQDQMVSGKDFTVPLHVGRNLSAGTGLSDGDTLPTAGQQSYNTTVVPNRYLYGRIEVSGPSIAATRDNVGAFVDTLNSEVDGLRRDFERDFNRQLNGNGTGWLAYWTGADNATPAEIDDGLGNAFVHMLSHASGDLLYDIVDESTHAVLSGAEDETLVLGAENGTSTAFAVTWDSGALPGGIADGDYVIRANSYQKEMMGIEAIIDNADPKLSSGATTLQGIASTTSYWKAQSKGSYTSMLPIAFEDIQAVIDAISTKSAYSEEDISFLLSNYGVRRAYYKLCIAERRSVNVMDLDGGFKAIEFNGLPWVVDSQAKRNTLFFVNTDTMKIFRTSDFDWLDKDGSYLSRVANRDAYEATLFHYGNLACLSRNGNGVLKGVIEA